MLDTRYRHIEIDTRYRHIETESNGAIEYLVFENALRDSASKFGLVPLTFPNALHDFFEPSNGVLKHFKPRYMSTSHPDLSDASRLFAGFAFVRV
jgi:hypothetical protein